MSLFRRRFARSILNKKKRERGRKLRRRNA